MILFNTYLYDKKNFKNNNNNKKKEEEDIDDIYIDDKKLNIDNNNKNDNNKNEYENNNNEEKKEIKFSKWVNEHEEIKNILENILKIEYIEENIKLTNNDNFIKTYSKEDEIKIVSIRDGDILSKFMIVKSDHFPECQRKFLNPSKLFNKF
jgi:hypothetical protein